MLAFVPVRFDLYRTVRAHLRWTLQNLIAFADRTGRCFPSARKLAEISGLSKSTAARHLAELVKDGHATRERERCPGSGWRFVYRIAAHFLPTARDQSGVPPASGAVSHRKWTEEKTPKKKEDSPVFTDDSVQWERRLQSWHHSGGKFWNAFWGPKPNEPGCFVPPALLTDSSPLKNAP